MINWLSAVYQLTLGALALFGLLGAVTLWLFWRHRDEAFPCPPADEASLPAVTVQLPLYNERFVVEKLLRDVAALDYPADRLDIQVLDDSDDETTEIAAGVVRQLSRRGVDIHLFHRPEREGYKAGALQLGLSQARGDYIAIFDADFSPPRSFLRLTVPHLLSEPRLGLVQARWGHMNGESSALTGAQRIAMDKHFALDQTVRFRADIYPRFNGTGGVWRRSCIEDAGGWEGDTLCEDLCLSTRAILRGWEFRLLNDVVVPAELPASMAAYKSQQARWAKGCSQCLFKFGRAILADGRRPFLARLYGLLMMAGYWAHPLLILLLLTLVPLVYLGYQPPSFLLVFGLAGFAQPILFVLSQKRLYTDWLKKLRHLPMLILLAIGLAAGTSRAIAEALLGRPNRPVRTPKGWLEAAAPARAYRLPFDWIIGVELLLAAYAAVGIAFCLQRDFYSSLPFLVASALGFGYVALASLRESL
ncbi:MAG: glycosyltransferase family 2 protein [Candidatus Promineifilaceae bacterium]